MSYSFIQTPATMSLAQSPVIFTVSSSVLVGQPNFQYIGELSIWTGSVTQSGSGDFWTLAKYPSTQGFTGIFDVSRILNSTMTTLTQTNVSSVKFFKMDSYYRYQSGSSYVTGSKISSNIYQGVDGYQIFPEPIGENIYDMTTHWPLMTDAPATQSIFIDNVGRQAVCVGDVGTTVPTSVKFVGDNGSSGSYDFGPAIDNTNSLINAYPVGPQEYDFPISTLNLGSYTLQAYNGATPLGASIKYNISCQQKYPNIRIKWKNRFAEFDYLNFDMVNRKSISSDKRTYQPQLGSWTGRTLAYNEWDTQTLNYIVDSKQNILCNTNWLSEDWNETLKQLLVSTEIYWCLENTTEVKPLTIVTSNINFKTGVNDHLIQYAFEFAYGQGYKLIL
jgi:hypothetical protein